MYVEKGKLMTTYKKEILSVFDGDIAIGFIARRHVIYGMNQEVAPGWCIMKPLVNLWEGNYATRKEAAEALMAKSHVQ